MSVKKNLTIATLAALLAVPAFSVTHGNHLNIPKFSDNLIKIAHADSGFNGDTQDYHSFTLKKPLTAINMYVPVNTNEPAYKADRTAGTHTFPAGDNVTTVNSGVGALWVGVHDAHFGNGENDIHDTVDTPSRTYKGGDFSNVPSVQNGKELEEEYGTHKISHNSGIKPYMDWRTGSVSKTTYAFEANPQHTKYIIHSGMPLYGAYEGARNNWPGWMYAYVGVPERNGSYIPENATSGLKIDSQAYLTNKYIIGNKHMSHHSNYTSRYYSGVPSAIQRGSWHTPIQRDKYNTYRQYPYTRTELHVYNDDVSYASDWYNSHKQFKVAGNGWGAGIDPKYKDYGNGKYVIDTSKSNGSISTIQKIDPYDMNIWMTSDNKTDFLGTFHKDGAPQYHPIIPTPSKRHPKPIRPVNPVRPSHHKSTQHHSSNNIPSNHHSNSIRPSLNPNNNSADIPTDNSNNSNTPTTPSSNNSDVTAPSTNDSADKRYFNGNTANSVKASNSKVGSVTGTNMASTMTSNGKLPQTNERNHATAEAVLGASALTASVGLMALNFAKKRRDMVNSHLVNNITGSDGKNNSHNKNDYNMIMSNMFDDLSKDLNNY